MYILKEIHVHPSAEELATIIFHDLRNAPSPSPHLNNHVLNLVRDTLQALETNIGRLTEDPRAQIYIREDYWEQVVAEGVFAETAKLVLAQLVELEPRRRGVAVEGFVGEGAMVQALEESSHTVLVLLQEHFRCPRNKLVETWIYLSTLAVLVLVSPPVFRMLGFEAAFPVAKSFADETVGGIPYRALLVSLRGLAQMHGRPLFREEMVVPVSSRADTSVLAGMMSFLESD